MLFLCWWLSLTLWSDNGWRTCSKTYTPIQRHLSSNSQTCTLLMIVSVPVRHSVVLLVRFSHLFFPLLLSLLSLCPFACLTFHVFRRIVRTASVSEHLVISHFLYSFLRSFLDSHRFFFVPYFYYQFFSFTYFIITFYTLHIAIRLIRKFKKKLFDLFALILIFPKTFSIISHLSLLSDYFLLFYFYSFFDFWHMLI